MSLLFRSRQSRLIWGCLALLVATFSVYYPASQASFIWDDEGYFINDPLMTTEGGFKKIWLSPEENNGYWPYLPITRSSFWLERQIWGLSFAKAHLINIFLHFCVSMCLYLGLRRFSIRAAWLIGFLFAVHPIHVQSVAWITERKNVLSGLFFLLSLIGYLLFKDRKTFRWYVFSLGMFLCAVLSKTSAVILPAVAELACFWLLPRNRWSVRMRDWGLLLPFLVIALLVSLLRIKFELTYFGAGASQFDLDVLQRILIATHSPFFYLGKIIFPEPLIFFYPRWKLDPAQLSLWLPLLSLFGSTGICLWKFHQWGRSILLGMLAYLIMLFPVMGFFNNAWHRFSFVADHWIYLPSIVVMTIVIHGVSVFGSGKTNQAFPSEKVFVPVMLVLFLILSGLTWKQTKAYQNAETLNMDTVNKNPDAWGAYNGLGSIYLKKQDYERAIEFFSKAIPGAPLLSGESSPVLNRGRAYVQLKHFDQALADFDHVIRLQPDNYHAYNERALFYIKKKQYALAEQDFDKALQINQHWAPAYQNRGNLHLLLKRYFPAFKDLSRAIELKPEIGELYNTRGVLQVILFSNRKAACSDWKSACQRGICQNYELALKKKDCGP
ncbi:MAG: tetratricopeptide repeat protein [SAR324 cluster bacterium]|nr:tetratricopeptide repeat protein [SAR324 cluster bacterium]